MMGSILNPNFLQSIYSTRIQALITVFSNLSLIDSFFWRYFPKKSWSILGNYRIQPRISRFFFTFAIPSQEMSIENLRFLSYSYYLENWIHCLLCINLLIILWKPREKIIIKRVILSSSCWD